MKNLLIISLTMATVMFFASLSWAFDDWVSASESSVPGTTDYNSYLSYLWRVVEQYRGQAKGEQKEIINTTKATGEKEPQERQTGEGD